MKVVVLGATGAIGSEIAGELVRRGHDVLGVSRSADEPRPWATARADATDAAAVAENCLGADVLASAVGPRHDQDDDRDTIVGTANALVEASRKSGVGRLVVLGGAGSLLTPNGTQLVHSPGFPKMWKANALAQAEALDVFRSTADLNWTYVSPAAEIFPGNRLGRWRIGYDELLVGDDGHSRISIADFAAAFADEVERPDARRARVCVAY